MIIYTNVSLPVHIQLYPYISKHSTTSLHQNKKTTENPSDFFFISPFKLFVSWFLVSAHRTKKTWEYCREKRRRRNWKGQLQRPPSSCYLLIDIFCFLSTNRLGVIQNPQWEMILHINYSILVWYDLFSLMINSWDPKSSYFPFPHTHTPKGFNFKLYLLTHQKNQVYKPNCW